MLLHARRRVIARQRCVAGRSAPGAVGMMALRRDRSHRRARVRSDNAGPAQLRRVRGRRDGGMAVIMLSNSDGSFPAICVC